MATLALLHLPMSLYSAASPRVCTSLSSRQPLSAAPTVYRAYPYMARSPTEQLFTSRCCKLRCEHLCQHHHQSCVFRINTVVHVSSQGGPRASSAHTVLPLSYFFWNFAIKKPIVSASALWGSGALAGVCSQLNSGLNLWRSRSCSGARPAPGMPSAPMWGSCG